MSDITITHTSLQKQQQTTINNKYFCPRLLDYVVFVGNPTSSSHTTSHPSSIRLPLLLRRYPRHDHYDFALPLDCIFFCQPEGCHQFRIATSSYHSKRRPSSLNHHQNNINSFVFTLTEKDTSRVRSVDHKELSLNCHFNCNLIII